MYVSLTWYQDLDGDQNGDSTQTVQACEQPAGYVSNADDNCDDLTACNYDAAENDECTYATTWYLDADGDGLGVATAIRWHVSRSDLPRLLVMYAMI